MKDEDKDDITAIINYKFEFGITENSIFRTYSRTYVRNLHSTDTVKNTCRTYTFITGNNTALAASNIKGLDLGSTLR